MTNLEFVNKLKNIVDKYNTTYMWGVFGSPITESIIANKVKQYPLDYNSTRQAFLRNLIGKNYFGFDCGGLIRGVLWGWNGNVNHIYGGAIYSSNGVPDIGANAFIEKCTNLSTDFSKIEIGEAIWRSGHIGVYIGDGRAIEAPDWQKSVRVSGISNIANISNIPNSSWTKHGKIPYITYINTSLESTILWDVKRYIVNTSSLNCRKEPNANTAIAGTFVKNTVVTGLRENSGWIFVSNGLVTGWCSASYLKEI